MSNDAVRKLASKVGFTWLTLHDYSDELIRFAELVAAAERERCAKVIEEADAYRGGHGYPPSLSASELAAMIRALP